MSRRFFRASACAVLLFGTIFFSCCDTYVEFNEKADEEINFLASASRLTFGTSTESETTVSNMENTVVFNPDSTLILKAKNDDNTSGKIAGSEDGITFYFKKVGADKNFKLSADVRVVQFCGQDSSGLTASNGQEGFGLMARDWVPQYPGKTIADNLNSQTNYAVGESGGSSNMVLVGGVKRGVRTYWRYGVTDPSGGEVIGNEMITPDASKAVFAYLPRELADYSMYPTLEERPDFPAAGSTYKLYLEKNNNGFLMRITPPADKGGTTEYRLAQSEMLTVIDTGSYYVGLFASRSAEAAFSNITYYESDRAKDAPKDTPALEVFTPAFAITSPVTNSDGSYTLYASSNVRGRITVKQDGVIVPNAEYAEGIWETETENNSVTPYMLFTVPVYPLKKGDNRFEVAYYPDEGQSITNNATIIRQFVVNRKSFGAGAASIYVAPDGSRYNDGSRTSPLDLETAINYVLPGQTIIMLDGTYRYLSVRIPRYNNGTFALRKTIKAENRFKAVIDFEKNYFAKGLVHEGNYWVIDGLAVCNTPDKIKGYTLMGDNNVLQWMKTFNNGDTGTQISGRASEPKAMWPKNNLVQFCDSYNNKDAAQSDADGFAAKLTVGEGNRFEWCVANNNCDDGWDLFTKKETGKTGAVTLVNCIAYQNGLLMDGTKTQSGRNGIKMGGEGLSVAHTAINCLSFNNGAHGFTSNSNPNLVLQNCTSFDNGGPVWNAKPTADSRNFAVYSAEKNSVTVNGALISTDIQGPSITASITQLLSLYSDPLINGVNRKEDKIWLLLPADGYVWFGPGTVTIKGDRAGEATKNKNGQILTIANNVVSTASPLNASGFIDRDADGHFILGDFLKLKNTASAAGAHF